MTRKICFVLIILIAGALAVLAWYWGQKDFSPINNPVRNSEIIPAAISVTPSPLVTPAELSGLVSPLDRPASRASQKKFGQYITPADSPVQPERFRGYHTGVDFEIFPEELNEDVAIKAICSGKLERKETVSGYGGVAVQSCTIDGNPVTVLYGHLQLASISKRVGDSLVAGESLAVLGADKSAATDGERKHLHLGISRGDEINVRGYVSDPAELSRWLDPCEYVCR